MAFVLKTPKCRFNVVPPPFIVKPSLNQSSNECTPLTSTNTLVKLGNNVVG